MSLKMSPSDHKSSSVKNIQRPKRKKRRKQTFRANFNVPGVKKLIISELTQQFLDCVVGDNVTAEKPWTSINKTLILEHIDTYPEDSEFLHVREEIETFPDTKILVGYIPDEEMDHDEFYVCLTEEATEAVTEMIEKLRHLQEEKLKNSILRSIKPWESLGSDKEIEEEAIQYRRPLIEVEIESRYPIFPTICKFKKILSGDLRDGYMELVTDIESFSIIIKQRTNAFVQVAPTVVSNEAQTDCNYPKNSFTQYEYESPYVPWENIQKSFIDFVSQNIDHLCDTLCVNAAINLYSSDYENLISNTKYSVKQAIESTQEYLCYINMDLSGEKMISHMSWHPMWTGCVVVCYVDFCHTIYVSSKGTTDEVYKAVHDINPVLFWSFNDDLKPKLILETPRPVYTLSCCPHNSNVILGGCINGQIIVWDITNKLINVEQEEVLTVDQQNYREYMNLLMYWMKNVFDKAKVRPTAISDLKNSHKGCIYSITWMSPLHNVTKTGRIDEIAENSPYSLQPITAAEDGTIMIWDLLKKPTISPGGFKAIRKVRRLQKRPAALMGMESPFRNLHLNLKPVYKINLINPLETNKFLSITSFTSNFFKYIYRAPSHLNQKKLELSRRFSFKPILNLQNSNPRPTFYVGTAMGDFIQGMWEGQKFDSGEIVNFEDSQIVHCGRYHDGPVINVAYSPINDTILTVGGKVFAFWRENFTNRPILWRKSKVIYTCGGWFHFEHATIKLIRIDGYSEIWTVFYQSKSPLVVKLMSNGAVNLLTVHPHKLQKKVFGLCDYRGCMRLFNSDHTNPLVTHAKEEQMSYFLTQEIERKKAFLTWQKDWIERHLSKVVVDEDEKKEVEEVFEIVEQTPQEEKKKIAKISHGMRHFETVQEQYQQQTQAKIKDIILRKKNLNTEDLMKKSEPLRKLEDENDAKKKRQRSRLRESDNIFKEQVAMLFPDVGREKPAPFIDPHQDYSNEDSKKKCFDDYSTTAANAENYVVENPFEHDFDWKTVIKEGHERRKKLLNFYEKNTHWKRYAMFKDVKAKLNATAAIVEAPKSEESFAASISTYNTTY